jgi:hypothetical protein
MEADSPARPASSAWSWKKMSLLGKGAFGSVYLGITSTGQLMAVKQVHTLSHNSAAVQNCSMRSAGAQSQRRPQALSSDPRAGGEASCWR